MQGGFKESDALSICSAHVVGASWHCCTSVVAAASSSHSVSSSAWFFLVKLLQFGVVLITGSPATWWVAYSLEIAGPW